jgi:hypothetical protein
MAETAVVGGEVDLGAGLAEIVDASGEVGTADAVVDGDALGLSFSR